MTGLFGTPPPAHPALLFGTLAGHGVDCVALGGLPAGGVGARRAGGGGSGMQLELAIERSFANCEALIEAFLELDTRILIDPRRCTPLARRSHPASLIGGEHRFDTVAGRLHLRDPRFVPGCAHYEELRAAAVPRRVAGVEIFHAGARHLAEIERARRDFDYRRPVRPAAGSVPVASRAA